MAISVATLLTSGNNNTGTGVTVFTTASVTPASSTVVILAAFIRYDSGSITPNVAGCGLTWTLIKKDNSSSSVRVLYVWEGRGTPSAGTITITRTGSETYQRANWHVFEFPGAHLTTPIVAANTVAASDGASTAQQTINYVQTFAAGSAGVGVWSQYSGNLSVTPRTNWTEIYDGAAIAGEQSLETQYRIAAETAGDATWSSATTGKQGIIFELAAAASGPAVPITAANFYRQMRG